MDSDAKARRDKENPKHTEALAATAKKISIYQRSGVAATEAFTAATLLYDSNYVRTLEACQDAVVAVKQWTKSAKAMLKSAQQTEDIETIGVVKEGLKLATAKSDESKQGVDQLEAVDSLAEASQKKIIQEN